MGAFLVLEIDEVHLNYVSEVLIDSGFGKKCFFLNFFANSIFRPFLVLNSYTYLRGGGSPPIGLSGGSNREKCGKISVAAFWP